MSDTTDKIYFNFPIELLSGFLIDKTKVLENIINYAMYAHSLTLNQGTKEQKFKSAGNFFGVSGGDITKGQNIYDSIQNSGVKVGISKNIFFDYFKNYKDEFEKVQLLAFLAIRSILKHKPYARITNAFMLARMDGKACSVKDYAELTPEIFKFANEYQTKKIKRALSEGWGLVTYSYRLHGFYVSFSLTLNELVLKAEMNRKKNKNLTAKKAVEAARQLALETIYCVQLKE